MIVQLKRELEETREKKEELQMELDSWKFNPERLVGVFFKTEYWVGFFTKKWYILWFW